MATPALAGDVRTGARRIRKIRKTILRRVTAWKGPLLATLSIALTAAAGAYSGWQLGQGVQFFALDQRSANLLILGALFAALASACVAMRMMVIKYVRPLILVSWFAVSFAASSLLSSTTWSTELEPDLYGSGIEVYVLPTEMNEWQAASVIASPTVMVNGTGDATLSVAVDDDHGSLPVVWHLPQQDGTTSCRLLQMERRPELRRLHRVPSISGTTSDQLRNLGTFGERDRPFRYQSRSAGHTPS
jgi:hypothetical protein